MQEWVSIEEFPGYSVSSSGEVRNDNTTRHLKIRSNKQGFIMVGLVREGVQHTRSVAMLVAHAFVPYYDYSEWSNSVIHLDGDRENCRADNLMWRTRAYAYAYHKMFSKPPDQIPIYIPDTDETFDSIREFCIKYGVHDWATIDALYNQTPLFYCGYSVKPAK